MLIDELELCGLPVDYYDGFISCLDWILMAPLQRIHCDVMLNVSKSVKMKKQTHKTNTF